MGHRAQRQIADAQEHGFLLFELTRKTRVGFIVFRTFDRVLKNRCRRHRVGGDSGARLNRLRNDWRSIGLLKSIGVLLESIGLLLVSLVLRLAVRRVLLLILWLWSILLLVVSLVTKLCVGTGNQRSEQQHDGAGCNQATKNTNHLSLH